MDNPLIIIPVLDWDNITLLSGTHTRKSNGKAKNSYDDTGQTTPETCPWCCTPVLSRHKHVWENCPVHVSILNIMKSLSSHSPARDDGQSDGINPTRHLPNPSVPTGFIMRPELMNDEMKCWSTLKIREFTAHLSHTLTLAMQERRANHYDMITDYIMVVTERANGQNYLPVTEYISVIERIIQV